MGEQINPETIERLADAQAAIRVLLNTVEELLQANQALRDEVQEWKDEVNRLKGEQGKRSIKPSKQSKPRDHSSERERKGPKERRKAKGLASPIDDAGDGFSWPRRDRDSAAWSGARSF